MSKTAVAPTPRVRSLHERIASALRCAQYWQISPVHAAHELTEVLAPRVVDRAEMRGIEVDEAGWQYIEAQLRAKLEAWLKARNDEREEEIRASLTAGKSYHGRASQVLSYAEFILAEFGSHDGNL